MEVEGGFMWACISMTANSPQEAKIVASAWGPSPDRCCLRGSSVPASPGTPSLNYYMDSGYSCIIISLCLSYTGMHAARSSSSI